MDTDTQPSGQEEHLLNIKTWSCIESGTIVIDDGDSSGLFEEAVETGDGNAAAIKCFGEYGEL